MFYRLLSLMWCMWLGSRVSKTWWMSTRNISLFEKFFLSALSQAYGSTLKLILRAVYIVSLLFWKKATASTFSDVFKNCFWELVLRRDSGKGKEKCTSGNANGVITNCLAQSEPVSAALKDGVWKERKMLVLDSFSAAFNQIITTDAIKFTFLFSLMLPQLLQEEIAYISQNVSEPLENVHERVWKFQLCFLTCG